MFHWLLLWIIVFLSSIWIYLNWVTEKVPNINPQGARVIVTGASEGLGFQLCMDLVKLGANVVLLARDQNKLDSALQKLDKFKRNNQIIGRVSADVSNFQSIHQGIVKAADILGGGFNVLINNAGITRPSRFEQLEIGWFERVMQVNYLGNVYAIRSAIPFLKKQKNSRVIAISSLAGLVGIMGYSCYSPTKAAIRSLYESLHHEYYAYGISFSVAFPGSIRTHSFEQEQIVKPFETKLFEEGDPILSPDVISRPIIHSLNNWKFLISPSGLNSWLLVSASGGFSPASVSEVIYQLLGCGVIRMVGLLLFNRRIRQISKRVHKSLLTT